MNGNQPFLRNNIFVFLKNQSLSKQYKAFKIFSVFKRPKENINTYLVVNPINECSQENISAIKFFYVS